MSMERAKEILSLLRVFIAIATAVILSLIGWMYMYGFAYHPLLARGLLILTDVLLLMLYYFILDYYVI